MNRKALILSIPMTVVVLLLGGWFLSREKEVAVEGENPPLVTENPIQNPEETIPPVSEIDTSSWKTYRNEVLKLSFKYPDTFRLDEVARNDGHVVSIMEYDGNKRDLDNKPIPGYFSPITVYYWKDLNNSHLIGGDWVGKKQYSNFKELIADTEHTYITVKGEVYLDGIKAYVVLLPGTDSGYKSILFEYAGGYYQINFPGTQKPLDENIKKEFISSIKFLK